MSKPGHFWKKKKKKAMLIISGSIYWDHPDTPAHMFTLVIMNRRLQQIHPSSTRLCWMIPGISYGSQPFLLPSGKKKIAPILSRQIFSGKGNSWATHCQFIPLRFAVPCLQCWRGLSGRDSKKSGVSYQWLSLLMEENIRIESEVFLSLLPKSCTSKGQSFYIRDTCSQCFT